MNPQQQNANNTASQNLNGSQVAMYNGTFGNANFALAPSMSGEVSNTFGTIPYLALESIIYAQAVESQVSPINIQSGQNQGTQNIQGSTQIADSNGQVRVQFGYSPSGF